MFQFGMFTANIVYIVFAAIYIISVGLFSINRLEAGKWNRHAGEQEQEKTRIVESSTVYDSGKSFHYSDYFADRSVKSETILFQFSEFKIPVLPEHVPDNALDFPILSRPPPSVW